MTLWIIRIFFLSLCTLGGYMVSEVNPDLISRGYYGVAIGFGLGGLLIAIDEMLKGFSLRAFSAATFGLMLGAVVAWLIDQSRLFHYVDEASLWVIRLCLYVAFGYIGMILAMRSNKEDFTLVIPYVRLAPQNEPQGLLLLDTSAIIDGRIVNLIDSGFLHGVIVVPRFVLRELHQLADAADPTKRTRGRRGLDLLSRLRRTPRREVKIHDADYPDETGVDAKLVRLAQALGAKLLTTDYNLSKVAELQSVPCLNITELAAHLKAVVLPGDTLSLRLVREGKERGQALGYLPDGTLVVVKDAHARIGHELQVQVTHLVQTGAGVIVFAELEFRAP